MDLPAEGEGRYVSSVEHTDNLFGIPMGTYVPRTGYKIFDLVISALLLGQLPGLPLILILIFLSSLLRLSGGIQFYNRGRL